MVRNQKKKNGINISKDLSKLPGSPGVYFFYDSEGTVIYVGKAINLTSRVRSYFQRKIPNGKTSALVRQIRSISYIQTVSEFDALILEARNIRILQPKYNSLIKDDKSPLYIRITTHEELPHIEFIRKSTIDTSSVSGSITRDKLFGPFQSGKMARAVMRSIRTIVPYCMQKKRTGKPCFYTQIGLCRPCPSEITGITSETQKIKLIQEYKRNIRRICMLLSGKSMMVLDEYTRIMKRLATELKFEEAVVWRNQRDALYQLLRKKYDPLIYDTYTFNAHTVAYEEITDLLHVLQDVYPEMNPLHRIECFDISNIQGSDASASMVVLDEGLPNNREYKRFAIKSVKESDDVSMMQEVIKRRFTHSEWNKPDLVVVDGGKGQVHGVLEVFERMNLRIPLIGLAKREEEIIIMKNDSFQTLHLPLTDPALHALQRVRDEAHRFAVSYHRIIRKKSFIS